MSKHYDYYVTDSSVRDDVQSKFDNEVGNKRNDLIQQLLTDTGAVAYTQRNEWGDTTTVIRSLCFPVDHELVGAKHMTKPEYSSFEGQRVAITRGKMNDKKGVEYNEILREVNDKLKGLPTFQDFCVEYFNVMRTGMGESTGRGVEMLQTRGGILNDGLGFMIPNSKGRHGDITIPDCFKKVTRGQWVDMTEDTE